MGFFDRIFGRKNVEQTEKQEEKIYSIESLEKILKEKIEKFQNEIEPSLGDYHRKILQQNEKIKESLKKLDVAIPKERVDEQLLFLAQTSRKMFKNKIMRMSDAINRSTSFDFSNFLEYYNNCFMVFEQSNASALNDFRSVGLVFKEEGNVVVQRMKELKGLLDDLGATLKKYNETYGAYDQALVKVLELKKISDSLKGDATKISEMKEMVNNKKEEIDGNRKELENLTSSDNWKEYKKEIEERNKKSLHSEEIKTEINEMMSSIERLIKKTQKMIEKEKTNLKYRKLVEGYVKNPFGTLLNDKNEEGLEFLLKYIKKFIIEKRIESDDKTAKKFIVKIDDWLSNKTFNRLKEEYLNSTKDVKKEIVKSEIFLKKSEIEKRISNLENEISEITKNLQEIETHSEEMKKSVDVKKFEIEDKTSHLLGEKIRVNIT